MAELNLLQKKILADGIIKSGDVLKVDSFLNHQIDVPLSANWGKSSRNSLPAVQLQKSSPLRHRALGLLV